MNEKKLLDAAKAGDVEYKWTSLSLPETGVIIEVTADALKWDGVRYGVSCRLQQQLADVLGGYLPTSFISDQCALQGTILPIHTMVPDHTMDDETTMREQSKWIDDKLSGLDDPVEIVCGWKDWILHPLMSTGRAVNYGWHATPAYGRFGWPHNAADTTKELRVVQRPSTAHTLGHYDYSQMCRLWRPKGGGEPKFAKFAYGATGCEWRYDVPLEGVPKVATRTTFGQIDKRGATAVRDWQDRLNEEGFGPLAEDGIHGTATEVASRAWEKAQVAELAVPVGVWRSTPNLLADDFVPSRSFTRGRPAYARPRGVVIHTAEMDEHRLAADRLASWTASGRAGVSWHYAVDSDSTIQSVLESDTAWCAGPGNDEFIHIELGCWASQDEREWADDYSTKMLDRAAVLVGDILGHYNVRFGRPSVEDILDGACGVVGHVDISDASQRALRERYREAPWWVSGRRRTTNHRDPGKSFPWDAFLAKALLAKGTA